MNETLRQEVWSRAKAVCEYFRVPQAVYPLPFGIDHVRPLAHGGPTVLDNLALACFDCNTFKGYNIAGYDPHTDDISRLFHPREDRWSEHFGWIGSELVGMTAVGRTTVEVLRINLPDRIELRRLLMEAGELSV